MQFNNKKSFNIFKLSIKKENIEKRNSNDNIKNKCILNNNKKKKKSIIIINDGICKKLKTMNTILSKNNNISKFNIFSSRIKRQTLKKIKRNFINEKNEEMKNKEETNKKNKFTKFNKSIS